MPWKIFPGRAMFRGMLLCEGKVLLNHDGAKVSTGYFACQSYERAQDDAENEHQQPS